MADNAGSPNSFLLPLAPFERYMLTDDRRDYPMSLIRQMLFAGTLQRPAFEAAVQQTLQRHPLLTARVDRAGAQIPSWRANETRVTVDWADAGTPLTFPGDDGEYIDLAAEPGTRVWVRQGAESALVTFQFHHAATDGTGAMQVLADVLVAYAAQTGNADTPAFSPLRPDLFPKRGDVATAPTNTAQKRGGFFSTLIKVTRFLTRRPTPLCPPRSAELAASERLPFPGIVSYTFGRSEVDGLRRQAREQNATLNDLLLRDLFLAVRDWNRDHATRPGRWLRVTMPVNLRSEDLESLPAANVMSYGFLTRDERACDRSLDFLRELHRETEEIKQGSARIFLRSTAIVQKLPGLERRMAGRKGCYATMVLSNVGDVTGRLNAGLPVRDGHAVAGDVVLQAVRGCPPLRLHTNAVFHVMTYAGELTIACRTANRWFSVAETQQLLARYVAEIEATRQGADRTPDPTAFEPAITNDRFQLPLSPRGR